MQLEIKQKHQRSEALGGACWVHSESWEHQKEKAFIRCYPLKALQARQFLQVSALIREERSLGSEQADPSSGLGLNQSPQFSIREYVSSGAK